MLACKTGVRLEGGGETRVGGQADEMNQSPSLGCGWGGGTTDYIWKGWEGSVYVKRKMFI